MLHPAQKHTSETLLYQSTVLISVTPPILMGVLKSTKLILLISGYPRFKSRLNESPQYIDPDKDDDAPDNPNSTILLTQEQYPHQGTQDHTDLPQRQDVAYLC